MKPRLKLALAVLLALAVSAFLAPSQGEAVPRGSSVEPRLNISQAPVELTSERTRTSKTYYLGETPDGRQRYALDASIGSVHYQNELGNWLEIDTQIVPSGGAGWDYEVVKGGYLLLIRDDTTVALEKDGNWLRFQYKGFAYYDKSTREYHILETANDITPVVTGNKIRWEGLFTGVNLEYIYANDTFKENLEITQVARDRLANHPPSEYGLNNSTSYLVGYLECNWLNAYPAEDKDGNSINFDDYESEGLPVYWRSPVKDKIVTALPLGYATHEDLQPDEWEKIRHRFYLHDNGKHYLLFGASVTALNQYPEGTIVIDPTIDEQIGASLNDAQELIATGAVFTNGTTVKCYADTGTSDYTMGLRFTSEGFPAQGTTITVAYISGYLYTSAVDDANFNIHFEELASPASFNASASFNISTRDRTENSTSWVEDSIAAGGVGFYDSPSLCGVGSPIQEIFDAFSPTALVSIYWPNNDAKKTYIIRSWDSTVEPLHTYAAKLHIEWSGDGVSAPTVVTNNSTSVEEATATLEGNMTATGGENCTARRFRWGAWGSFTDNWTETGSFGTGNFTHAISGLSPGIRYQVEASANNSAGWGSGATIDMLTKPNAPSSLSITDQGSTWIYVQLTKGSGANRTEVRYDSTCPTDNASGTLAYYDTGTSVNITGLTPGAGYGVSGWSLAKEGNWVKLSDTYTCDSDYTLPGDASNAASSNVTCTSFDVEWTEAAGANVTVGRWKTGSYPTGPADGTLFYNSSGNITTITGLPASSLIYVGLWPQNTDSGYYSANSEQTTETTNQTLAPTIVTGNATDVTHNSATLSANITDVDCQNATSRGFQYGLACDNLTDNTTAGGSFGTGSFSLPISGLSSNTTISFRGFAGNGGGISFGACGNFTTSAAPAPPPEITSANVSVWFENTLVANVTVEITDLEAYLIAAAEAHAAILVESQNQTVSNVIGLVLVGTLLGLSYWHRERWPYVIAGFGTLLYAFIYSETDVQIASLIGMLAVYNFFKAAVAKKGGS